jgi:hypothetical protein
MICLHLQRKWMGIRNLGLYWQGLEVSCGFESRELLPGFEKASNSDLRSGIVFLVVQFWTQLQGCGVIGGW